MNPFIRSLRKIYKLPNYIYLIIVLSSLLAGLMAQFLNYHFQIPTFIIASTSSILTIVLGVSVKIYVTKWLKYWDIKKERKAFRNQIIIS